MHYKNYEWSMEWYQTSLSMLETVIHMYGTGVFTMEQVTSAMAVVALDKERMKYYKSKIPLQYKELMFDKFVHTCIMYMGLLKRQCEHLDECYVQSEEHAPFGQSVTIKPLRI